jgi:hypothetical protein
MVVEMPALKLPTVPIVARAEIVLGPITIRLEEGVRCPGCCYRACVGPSQTEEIILATHFNREDGGDGAIGGTRKRRGYLAVRSDNRQISDQRLLALRISRLA